MMGAFRRPRKRHATAGSPRCCAAGIDEAGRGPVLGPLVYGAAFCAVSNAAALAKAAYADSKTLTEEKREVLFEKLKADGAMGWMVDSISAAELSAKMLRRRALPLPPSPHLSAHAPPPRPRDKYSLNSVSFDSAYGLIQAALDAGVNLTEVFVDTVGDEGQYTKRLNERFPGIKAVVKAKADRDFPVVSAASICAKVTRDRELRDFQFEPGLREATGRAFGCGYPGDEQTKAWLLAHVDRVMGFPDIVRFSWATTKRLLEGEAGAVAVRWEADADDEEAAGVGGKRTGRLAFGGLPNHLSSSSGAGRHSFFRSRKLQRVNEW